MTRNPYEPRLVVAGYPYPIIFVSIVAGAIVRTRIIRGAVPVGGYGHMNMTITPQERHHHNHDDAPENQTFFHLILLPSFKGLKKYLIDKETNFIVPY